MEHFPNRSTNRTQGADHLAPVSRAQIDANRARHAAAGQHNAPQQAPSAAIDQATHAMPATQQPTRAMPAGKQPADTASATQQPTRAMPAMAETARRARVRTDDVPRPMMPAGAPGPSANTADGAPAAPRKHHRAVAIGLGVVAGALVIAYAAGAVAFSNTYYPNTTIAGIDVSLTDAATAAERIEQSVGTYSLDVSGLGFTWSYTPEPGTFSVDADEEAEAVLAANDSLLWPVHLIAHLTGAAGGADDTDAQDSFAVTYDEAAFEAALGAAIDEFNAPRAGTFDAAGAYDEASGQFTVAKARSSQRLSRDAVIAAAKDAVGHAEAALELDDSMYEPLAGGATDEQLQAACDAANDIIGVNVTLKYGDTPIATLDGKTMTQWITFDENLNPVLNADGLSGWIRDLAVNALDTVGTERTYTRADGKQVTVSGGTFGWVSDEAALAQTIQDAVATKQTGDIQIPTKQTGDRYTAKGERDWGAYVDIDLTEQWVRYYDENDNLLWESGCISGSPVDNNYTPTGIYFLNSNSGGATLTGADEDGDGEPDYKTPVSYWMPFVGGAVGLHDADWQDPDNFGNPTAYQWTGSHGCVNLPPEKAAELSSMITVGTCVITHY